MEESKKYGCAEVLMMLKQIKLNELSLNPFTMIGDEWMLISAGDEQKYNMMTAAWGGLGVMWGKSVAAVVIRPTRYTLDFVKAKDHFALNFFDSSFKPVLSYCGSHSGRDVDKEKGTGLTPVFTAQAPYFAQAKLVMVCRKLYQQKLDPGCFLDGSLDAKWYPEKDYHECFVGEIAGVWKSE